MINYSTPLKFSEHAGLRLVETNDFSYARDRLLTPVLFTEMAAIAREYPIVFPDNKTDLPHALMGLEAGVNAYVAADGRWLAAYIPATVRQYPFALKGGTRVEGTSDRRFSLMFDPASPMLGKTHGVPVFTDDGKLTAAIQSRVKLLQQMQKEALPTRRMVKALNDVGILVERKVKIRSGGKTRTVAGMKAIDEKALNALPDEAFNKLRKEGALPLAYAHLLSWANFRQGAIGGKYPELAKPAENKTPFDFGTGTLPFSSLS